MICLVTYYREYITEWKNECVLDLAWVMFPYLEEVDTLDDVDIEDDVDTELEVDTLKENTSQ